jgi:ribosomal protein S18 acetylase RimI-like enzyme
VIRVERSIALPTTYSTIARADVIPDHRSRGIGTALVSAVIERARETGSVAVDLEIDADHSRAASLYQRLGFRPLQRSRWVKELSN